MFVISFLYVEGMKGNKLFQLALFLGHIVDDMYYCFSNYCNYCDMSCAL